MKTSLFFVALIVLSSVSIAARRDAIALHILQANEVHDGCGTELWLKGADEAGPEVFDYLDTKRGEVAHVRVNDKLHSLRFSGWNPDETWKDNSLKVVVRTRATDTGEDAAKLRGTLTIFFLGGRRTYRVEGWVGC